MARTQDDESEGVVVNTDNPRVVVLELHDGKTLALDPVELRSSIESKRVAA
jgi:hypothetical protein